MNSSAPEPIATETRDLDELLDEVESLMFRLARLIGALHRSGGDGLSPPQYVMLRALEKSGPMRVSDVASDLGMKNPAASMLLQAMKMAGLVERRSDPEDGRAKLVSVSEIGMNKLKDAEATRADLMREVLVGLTPEELAGMLKGLNLLVDALGSIGEGYEDGDEKGTT